MAAFQAVYNFLWGDLVTLSLPGGGSVGLSLLVLLLICLTQLSLCYLLSVVTKLPVRSLRPRYINKGGYEVCKIQMHK